MGEAASNNPITGSYTTDSTAPVITITSPSANQIIPGNSATFTMVVNEPLSWAAYSIDGNQNVTMTNISAFTWAQTNTSISNKNNYTVTFYANDSYNNLAQSTINFTIDSTRTDTTPPVITILSPVNNTYYTTSNILLNITTDEALSWAGYKLDSGAMTDLGNASSTNWNKTISVAEGAHNITFYANDSSSNKNQANETIPFYVDLTNPQISSFTCTTPVNDRIDVNCSASVSDSVGLGYAIINYNATGAWQNSSQINLTGTSLSFNYTISAGNTTPGSFGVNMYLFDNAGNQNLSSATVTVLDDQSPRIFNITYLPNTTAALDPGVPVNVNATILENYNISSVSLMWMNLSDGIWQTIQMTNNSAIPNQQTMNILYNATFIPQNGTYIFRINATDSAGNYNLSSNYTLDVENDTTYWNSSTIPYIKSVSYSERSGNNSLGFLYLNNTGDTTLGFNISIISSTVGSRLNINYTGNQSANYSLASNQNMTLTILANTTDLTANLYPYNVIITSQAGTLNYSNNLNIQTSTGPYLLASISQYSQSVTRGQTDIELISSVSNFGSQDVSGVTLTWTLPSGFTLTSGSLARTFATIPIGSTFTNTIIVSVSDSITDSQVNLSVAALASDGSNSTDSKIISISNPIIQTQTVAGGGAGGGGGGLINAVVAPTVYNQEVEVVRGLENTFKIEVPNNYVGTTLKDLTLKIEGFPDQYVSVSSDSTADVNYGDKKTFTVHISAPSYSSYEIRDLTANIAGTMSNANFTKSYSQTQTIKLTIQEVSKTDAESKLQEASQAVIDMKNRNFSTASVGDMLNNSQYWLNIGKIYQNSMNLSESIIQEKQTAFQADDLLRRDITALYNPKSNYLLVGGAIFGSAGYDNQTSLRNLLTGQTVFSGSSAEDLISLGVAAFERGDYSSALSRAQQAREALIVERKGNLLFFIYAYWEFLLIGLILISGAGTVLYKQYQKGTVNKKIEDLNKKEENVRHLTAELQKEYFSGKISNDEYNLSLKQHRNELARMKKTRNHLANIRIKLIAPQKITTELDKENKDIEKEIKKIQESYYKEKNISEEEYRTQFNQMNERLADIEDERTTIHLLEKKSKVKYEPEKKKIFSFGKNKKEEEIKKKINEILKENGKKK